MYQRGDIAGEDNTRLDPDFDPENPFESFFVPPIEKQVEEHVFAFLFGKKVSKYLKVRAMELRECSLSSEHAAFLGLTESLRLEEYGTELREPLNRSNIQSYVDLSICADRVFSMAQPANFHSEQTIRSFKKTTFMHLRT